MERAADRLYERILRGALAAGYRTESEFRRALDTARESLGLPPLPELDTTRREHPMSTHFLLPMAPGRAYAGRYTQCQSDGEALAKAHHELTQPAYRHPPSVVRVLGRGERNRFDRLVGEVRRPQTEGSTP